MDSYQHLLIYLAGPAIIGLVTAIIFLWRDLAALKLHIAESYTKKSDLTEMKQDVRDMKSVVYEIAAKVGVTVHRPF